MTAYAIRPYPPVQDSSGGGGTTRAAQNSLSVAAPTVGPLTTELQRSISDALKATAWPLMDPPMEDAIAPVGPMLDPDVRCFETAPITDPGSCTWGSSTAPVKIALVGDSVSGGYAGPLREIAVNSGGRVQVQWLSGICPFTIDMIDRTGLNVDECSALKQHAVDVINSTKPDAVIVAHRFVTEKILGSDKYMTPDEWAQSVRGIVQKFSANTKKVVFMSQPAGSAKIEECYSKRGSTPRDCIGSIDRKWSNAAGVDAQLAEEFHGVWIDPQPWFCAVGTSTDPLCPSFVGTTPTKRDFVHLAPVYGRKIYPVIEEALRQADVIPGVTAPKRVTGGTPPR